MIVLHHLDNSRSQRILWMLEELGLQYEVRFHKRDPKTMLAPDSLRTVHPLGKSPVLVDDDLVLVESAAILEYLVDKYGKGKFRPPEGSTEKLRYTFWMHFAEGSAMTPLLLRLVFDKVSNPPLPLLAKTLVGPIAKGISSQVNKVLIAPNLKNHQAFIEAELEKSLWFAGSEFTAADAQMSFVLEAGAARGPMTRSTHPKIFNFLERIHSRPAYKRAIEVGGPYGSLS